MVLAQHHLISHCRDRSVRAAFGLVLKRAECASIPVREYNPEMKRAWTASALLAISVRLGGFRVNSGSGQGRKPGLYRESGEEDPDRDAHPAGQGDRRQRSQEDVSGHRRAEAGFLRGLHVGNGQPESTIITSQRSADAI